MADQNDSSLASSNEEFQKFLDEPLSTTESEHADSSIALGLPSKAVEKKEVQKEETSQTSSWLKKPKAEGQASKDVIGAGETSQTSSWLKKPKAEGQASKDVIGAGETSHTWLKKPKAEAAASERVIGAGGNNSKVKITLEKKDAISEDIIELEKASSDKSSPRISSESNDKSKSECSSTGKSLDQHYAIKKTVSNNSHEHSSESNEKLHSKGSSRAEEEHSLASSSSASTSENSELEKPHERPESSKSSQDQELSNADYSSAFEEEDNSGSGTLKEEKDRIPGSSDAPVRVSDDADEKSMPEQLETTKDHSFLDMVLHSEKVEDDIIQELRIDERQLNVRDVLQESSESSDSEKINLEPSEDEVSKTPVHVPVTKIPTSTRRFLENKQTREKNVTFARGVLSESEKKLEKEIEELKREIEEQETLIKGYQTENEKLYSELKHEKKAAHIAETKWRIEAEKLKMEVGKLREQGRRFEIGKRKIEHPTVHEHADYSNALLKVKESSEKEKKKSKELQERMSIIQKQMEELSQGNEALAKSHRELLESHKLLSIQLHETETVSAKWKFEAAETKTREDELRKEISRKEIEEKSLRNGSLETERLQLQMKRILKELEQKDANTKMILHELEQQHKYIKQRYQKHLQEAESEENKQIREMGLKLQMLEKELQDTEEKKCAVKPEKGFPPSYRTIGVQVHHFESIDLENKEMKLKLERLTLQLEDLETKYGRLQAEQLKHNFKIKADPKQQQDILKKVCKQERKHSSMVVHLQNRIENLEILTNHLSSHLEESEQNCLLLSNENANLKKTIEDLSNELLPKQKHRSVEGKTLLQIEKNIFDLQRWHQKRETALWAATANSCSCSIRFQSEMSKWQQRVIEKNLEIDAYRRELDTLVEFLQRSQEES